MARKSVMKLYFNTFRSNFFAFLVAASFVSSLLLGPQGAASISAQIEPEEPFGGRTMTIVSVTAQAGTQVVVPIELDSQGNESSMSFSLNFDPAIFSNPLVTLGTGVPVGANLGVNANQAAQGRIGILVDSTSSYTVSPPNRQVVTVRFDIAANAPVGASAITFVTSPTPLSVSSAAGALLPTVYQVGTVTVTAPPVQFVTISGRVTTPAGQNLRNTPVTMIDSEGVRRVATTSSFGIFTFNNVATNQTYTFTVTSKRFRFAPQIVNVTGAINNLDFVGLE